MNNHEVLHDGAFVESHGREVMEIINPTNRKVIAQVTLADEDARRAVATAKQAFVTFGRSTKEERAKILRRLHCMRPLPHESTI
jgi:aldehyde dehydrogenase (NAD+)